MEESTVATVYAVGGVRVQLTCCRRNHRGQGGAGRTGGCHLRSVQVAGPRLCAGDRKFAAPAASGRLIRIFRSRPARASPRHLSSSMAGRTNNDDVLQRLHTVTFGKQLRHDGRLNIGERPETAYANKATHLVEEHDNRVVLPPPLTGGKIKISRIWRPSHQRTYRVSALNVQEVAASKAEPGSAQPHELCQEFATA